jgi:DnaJ-class molecular chaperone
VEYKDYYRTLGVKRGASEAEIKAAYRRLARRHHPDVNPGDKGAAERFKEINEAHEVLSKPELRARYDSLGGLFGRFSMSTGSGGSFTGTRRSTAGVGTATGEAPPFRGGRTPGVDGTKFSEFFHSLFGQAAGTPRGGTPQRGLDIEQPLQVGLEEAATGGQRVFSIRGQERCAKCLGTGESPPGKQCVTCHGSGAVDYNRRIQLKIPPGAYEGLRLRIPGEGNPGANGGEKGDLLFVVTIKPHALYRREGDDLHVDVDTPYLRLILGGDVQVPTLLGKVALTVPPHTQNGRVFRLSAKGLPHLKGGGSGDLFAHLRAVLPTTISSAEREHFEALARLSPTS